MRERRGYGGAFRRRLVLGATALAVVALGVVGLLASRQAGVLAQRIWPTPPPGRPFQVPTRAEEVRPVEPAGPLSRVFLLQPRWPGPLPLVPPVASETYTLYRGRGGPMTLTVEAGAWEETLQVRSTPLSAEEVSGLRPGWQVLEAVRLEAFNADGKPVEPTLQRPAVLTIPVQDAGADLLVAYRPPKGENWLPLVTETRSGSVSVRILTFGDFILVRETETPSAVSVPAGNEG